MRTRLTPVWMLVILTIIMQPLLVASQGHTSDLLTMQERDWLDTHADKLVLYYNVEFPPIEFESDDGRFIGMGADVIQQIESVLDITFLKVPSYDWNDHLSALESGRCAIAPTIVRTQERVRYAFFTDPYATVPVVILSTRQTDGKLSLEELAGKRVGVVSGYATEQYIRDRSLLNGFEVVLVDNVPEGLNALSFGQIDVYVENLAVAAYFIDEIGIPNLRVAGTTDYAFAWSVGISRQYPLLYSSIQKALESIPLSELEKIRKQWIALEIQPGLDEETIKTLQMAGWFALALIFCLSIITFLLRIRLKKGVGELKKRESESTESKKMLELVMDSIPQHIFWKDRESRYLGCNHNFAAAKGLDSPDAIIGKTDYDLSLRKEEAESFRAYDQKVLCSGLSQYHILERQRQLDGKHAWLDTNKVPLFDQSGKIVGVLGTYEDITERKLSEQALLESQELIRKQHGKFQKDLLMSMIQILELYDLYTKGHSENVARYSSLIAEKIRSDTQWIKRVYWAGLVHDIGKLLIPTNVLNKVSRLTKEEYELIKMHPIWGAKVLSTSEQIRDIGHYVLHHHERYDGMGYPDGKKGKDIPLASRIIAVADAYDAMTSQRAYRDPFSAELVRKEIMKGSGTQFDPEIVDHFFSLGLEAQGSSQAH